ncbi:hypothetical protein PVAND_005981 [Polypedilum vanderplanki]|uniref:Sepiapterin reductase n=1 Tax=Polypedilum vanderplanki TaxID=319348 RepID=A0A9J6C284_POLVA|nr:hypothetical protein PVAND_005981 [Polypedilum vanderplanki]
MAKNQIDLNNKLVYLIITGASRGIGKELAIETSKNFKTGSTVVLLARSKEGLENTKKVINETNKNVEVIIKSIDLTKPSVEELDEIINNSFDASKNYDLTMIIHNVGTLGDISKWSNDMNDYNELEQYFSTNVFAPVILNNRLLKVIPKSMKTFIVNITSKAALHAFKSFGFYCMGKAAREMYFKMIAEEFKDLLVLNYSPGPVESDMTVYAQNASISEETSGMFKQLRNEGTILTTAMTTKRFLEVVAAGKYNSGDHMLKSSNFHQSFLFLTKLAYKNRITIPVFVCVAFLVCNFRWEIEISIQTERLQVQANNSDQEDIDLTDDDSDNSDDEYEPVSTDDELTDI